MEKGYRRNERNVKHKELPAVKYYVKNQMAVPTCFSSCAPRGLERELSTM